MTSNLNNDVLHFIFAILTGSKFSLTSYNQGMKPHKKYAIFTIKDDDMNIVRFEVERDTKDDKTYIRAICPPGVRINSKLHMTVWFTETDLDELTKICYNEQGVEYETN